MYISILPPSGKGLTVVNATVRTVAVPKVVMLLVIVASIDVGNIGLTLLLSTMSLFTIAPLESVAYDTKLPDSV